MSDELLREILAEVKGLKARVDALEHPVASPAVEDDWPDYDEYGETAMEAVPDVPVVSSFPRPPRNAMPMPAPMGMASVEQRGDVLPITAPLPPGSQSSGYNPDGTWLAHHYEQEFLYARDYTVPVELMPKVG